MGGGAVVVGERGPGGFCWETRVIENYHCMAQITRHMILFICRLPLSYILVFYAFSSENSAFCLTCTICMDGESQAFL